MTVCCFTKQETIKFHKGTCAKWYQIWFEESLKINTCFRIFFCKECVTRYRADSETAWERDSWQKSRIEYETRTKTIIFHAFKVFYLNFWLWGGNCCLDYLSRWNWVCIYFELELPALIGSNFADVFWFGAVNDMNITQSLNFSLSSTGLKPTYFLHDIVKTGI